MASTIRALMGICAIWGMLAPAAFSPESGAASSWESNSDANFLGAGSSFTDCQLDGIGADARIRLNVVPDWWNQKPSSSPSGLRDFCTLASVGNDDKIVLFGGGDGTNTFDDTWIYNPTDNTWLQRFPKNKPTARCLHAMSTVWNDDKVILFGGYSGYSTNIFLNDTWVYDLGDDQWYPQKSIIHPSGRYSHAMTSINNNSKVVLFGGSDLSGTLGDTWLFDLVDGQWTNPSPSDSPSPRENHAMATVWYDDRLVLFGGYSGNNLLNDTWVFDLSDNRWYRKSPKDQPSARSYHKMVTILNNRDVLLFGGSDLSAIRVDTWTYRPEQDQWNRTLTKSEPTGGNGHAMAAVHGSDRIVRFDGFSNETWVYDPAGYSRIGKYLSPYYDTGGTAGFMSIKWSASIPIGTAVGFQLRTADASSSLKQAEFAGPFQDPKQYYSNGSNLSREHYGKRWVQYMAQLNTSDPERTPSLTEVILSYNRFPDPPKIVWPLNGNWTNESNPTFKWNFSDSDSSSQGGFEWQTTDSPTKGSINHSSGEIGSDAQEFKPNESLDEGIWYWRVRTADLERDWGPFSAYRMLGIDISPPSPFTPRVFPTGWTKSAREVTFSTNDILSGVVEYHLWIDDNPAGVQTSPFTFPDLTDGVHNITIRAYDRAGNFAEGKARVLLDRERPAPFVPIAIPPSWTNTDPQIEFNTTDATSGIDHYEVRIDSQLFSRQASPFSLKGLADGEHSVLVRAYDVAGNYQDGNLSIFMDRTPPVSLFIALEPPGWTNATPVMTFSALDTMSDIDHFEVRSGNGTYTNQTSPYICAGLPEGANPMTVRVFDRAGNHDEGIVQALIDRTPPDPFIPVADPGNWTRFQPVITFSTSDGTSGIGSYSMSIDGGGFVQAASPVGLGRLPDGRHAIIVRAFDRAGNFIEGTVPVFIDTSAPVNVSVRARNGARATGGQNITLAIFAMDIASGLGQMCFSNDGTTYSDWEPFSPDKSWRPAPGGGERTIFMKVRDRAGNEAAAASASITVQGAPVGWVPISLSILLICALMAALVYRSGRKKPDDGSQR